MDISLFWYFLASFRTYNKTSSQEEMQKDTKFY